MRCSSSSPKRSRRLRTTFRGTRASKEAEDALDRAARTNADTQADPQADAETKAAAQALEKGARERADKIRTEERGRDSATLEADQKRTQRYREALERRRAIRERLKELQRQSVRFLGGFSRSEAEKIVNRLRTLIRRAEATVNPGTMQTVEAASSTKGGAPKGEALPNGIPGPILSSVNVPASLPIDVATDSSELCTFGNGLPGPLLFNASDPHGQPVQEPPPHLAQGQPVQQQQAQAPGQGQTAGPTPAGTSAPKQAAKAKQGPRTKGGGEPAKAAEPLEDILQVIADNERAALDQAFLDELAAGFPEQPLINELKEALLNAGGNTEARDKAIRDFQQSLKARVMVLGDLGDPGRRWELWGHFYRALVLAYNMRMQNAMREYRETGAFPSDPALAREVKELVEKDQKLPPLSKRVRQRLEAQKRAEPLEDILQEIADNERAALDQAFLDELAELEFLEEPLINKLKEALLKAGGNTEARDKAIRDFQRSLERRSKFTNALELKRDLKEAERLAHAMRMQNAMREYRETGAFPSDPALAREVKELVEKDQKLPPLSESVRQRLEAQKRLARKRPEAQYQTPRSDPAGTSAPKQAAKGKQGPLTKGGGARPGEGAAAETQQPDSPRIGGGGDAAEPKPADPKAAESKPAESTPLTDAGSPSADPITVFVKTHGMGADGSVGPPLRGQIVQLFPSGTPDLPSQTATRVGRDDTGYNSDPLRGRTGDDGLVKFELTADDAKSIPGLSTRTSGSGVAPSGNNYVAIMVVPSSAAFVASLGAAPGAAAVASIASSGGAAGTAMGPAVTVFQIGREVFAQVAYSVPRGLAPDELKARVPGDLMNLGVSAGKATVEIDICRIEQPGPWIEDMAAATQPQGDGLPGASISLGLERRAATGLR